MTRKLIIAFAFVAILAAHTPSQANADGPLRRWWRNLTGKNCCQPTPQCNTCTTANYPVDASSLQPGQCMKTCQQTCSRTVVNYVPQTAYRTVYNRVPVTQYKPVTTSDPCTGCTVTCMKPCTSYTYQCQRVPYTTYRPVYRQETYSVPVTTITNDCATGNCATGTCATGNCGAPAGCSTCGTGVASAVPNYSPNVGASPYVGSPTPAQTQTYYETPGSTLSTEGGYQSTPADVTPALDNLANPQSSQRPMLNPYNPSVNGYNSKVSAPTPVYQQLQQPAVIQIDDRTAQVPVRQKWSYSPMRLASHQPAVDIRRDGGVIAQPVAATTTSRITNSRWVEVQ